MVNIVKKLEQLKKKYRYSVILIKELVITEFKLRYQGSVLGYLWSLLKPLFLFIILYFVFVYFLKIGAGIPHWPVSMLLGIVIWNYFAEITNGGLKSVVSRGGLIRNINFPKYIIIISSAISASINLFFNLIIVFIFTIINGVPLTFNMLLLPIYLIEILVFGVGIAFTLSSFYVKFRDIQYIWEIIMQGLFYASAAIFPISKVLDNHHTIGQLMLMNPVAQALQDARRVFINPDLPNLHTLNGNPLVSLIPILIVGVVFIFGAWYFRKKSPYFAENV